jgi:repressor LexA
MTLRLTERQAAVLRYFRDYRQERGIAPTLEEAAQALGVSKITIHEHLTHLAAKGAIVRDRAKSRSVAILYDPDGPTGLGPSLPVLGTIAAGRPIEAIEDREIVQLTELIPTDDDIYLLRVRGKSMIDDHIDDGDLVVVRRTNVARNGDIVVAIVDDGHATLKRFFREGNRIRLQPANPELQPTYPQQLEVRGVVQGVIRRFR